jgi:hypothetical protein
MVERLAPLAQRIRNVRKRLVRVRLEVLDEVPRRRLDHASRAPGDGQQVPGPSFSRRPLRRRLLEDHVCVRPAHAQRAHSGPAPFTHTGPRDGLAVDEEGGRRQLELRVGCREVHRRGNLPVLQRLDHLDQARDAGGRIQVPDVRLHGAQGTEAGLLGLGPERLGQRRHLDGVADGRGGPVPSTNPMESASTPATDTASAMAFA